MYVQISPDLGEKMIGHVANPTEGGDDEKNPCHPENEKHAKATLDG